jgi:hypothetical protein
MRMQPFNLQYLANIFKFTIGKKIENEFNFQKWAFGAHTLWFRKKL